MHLIQISDSHLFKDEQGELLGCNTRQCFNAILNKIKKEESSRDLIMLTGDLSHDGSYESYQYLADSLRELKSPVCWIPGNHDNLSTLQEVFAKTDFINEKELNFKNWELLLLDSLDPGKVTGLLREESLALLDEFLKKSARSHRMVVLHHQPIPVGSEWLDGVGLLNHREFRHILLQPSNLCAVIFGHVHQDFDQTIKKIRYLGSPATSIQFQPGCVQFKLHEIAPGYRYMKLNEDGTIRTAIRRLHRFSENLDYQSRGY